MKLALSLIINNKQVDWQPLTLITWSINDYKQQWIDALERIKIYDSSCLVIAYVFNKTSMKVPHVETYDLHKNEGILYIQPRLFFSDSYLAMLREKIYSAETCYDFIKPIKTHNIRGYELVYWTCKYDEQEINQLIEELKKDTSK